MILADKIIDLRKKNGWSQEELAEKMDVSRQSISKWESAQSVPDMARVLLLSELFGVSTDYLLKDDMGAAESAAMPEADTPARQVSMEEADGFLKMKERNAVSVALGAMLCVLSPVVLILLGAAQEYGRLPLTENQAGGLGLIVLFVLAAFAVALFVSSALRISRYEYLEKEPIDTLYGVSGMARERREQFRGVYSRQLTAGVVLCVLSVIPIGLALLFAGEDEFLLASAIGELLALVSVGVMLIVRSCIVWDSFQILLEEGDYSRENKLDNIRHAPVQKIYWLAVLAVYFAWSFITGAWDRSWIVWPIAGVAWAAVFAVMKEMRKKNG